jgi:hypothetical protein
MSICKKKEQLGMNPSTAQHRLKKNLMFSLVQRLGEDICFQCHEKIETVEELSVEHKIPWLDSEEPLSLFFDLENISFSHLACNCRAGRREQKYFSDEEREEAKREADTKYRQDNKDKINARRMELREEKNSVIETPRFCAKSRPLQG